MDIDARRDRDDDLDEALEETFPASDPPAYIRQKSYISEKTGQSSTQLKVSIRCRMSF